MNQRRAKSERDREKKCCDLVCVLVVDWMLLGLHRICARCGNMVAAAVNGQVCCRRVSSCKSRRTTGCYTHDSVSRGEVYNTSTAFLFVNKLIVHNND